MAYKSDNLNIEQIEEIESLFNIKLPTQSNSLYDEIKEILYWSKYYFPEYGKRAIWFQPAATEEELTEWEQSNNITIPSSYKDWLRFSCSSQILDCHAGFNSPKDFEVHNAYLPDLVIIGWIIGDGEILCFSKSTGEIVRYFDGKMQVLDNMKSLLQHFISLI